MGRVMTPKLEPIIALLDHSVSPGGAQLALIRTLSADSASRLLFIPNDPDLGLGVYIDLVDDNHIRMLQLGPPQKSGATAKIRNARKLLSFAWQVLGQAIALRRCKSFVAADIVHANSARAALYGAIACAWSAKIFIVHLRDMTDPISLGRIGFETFTKVALRRADAVIANSEATLISASPYLRRPYAKVIPSPIGISGAPKFMEVQPKVTRIGMVARIDSWKGHEVAIRAFAKTFKNRPVQLLFAGGALFGKDDHKSHLLTLAAELGLSSQIIFLGHISDVEEFILSLDICLQTSIRAEPLGQNVLQYLRLGRPTIAMNEGGPAEWIKDGQNGILVTPNNVDALSAAMVQLSDNFALRRALSTAAKDTPNILSDMEVAAAQNNFYQYLAREIKA